MSMDVEVLSSNPTTMISMRIDYSEKERFRVKRKTLQALLDQCQRALELLNTTSCVDDDDEHETGEDDVNDSSSCVVDEDRSRDEADELCDLLKSRVECPNFLA